MGKRTINAVFRADNFLERVVSLCANLHRLREAGRANGEEHELLERKLVACVRATVDNVERGARQHVRWLDARQLCDVLVERDTFLRGTRLSDGDGHTEDRVRAELALVGRAVELLEEVIDLGLLGDDEAGLDEGGGDGVVHVGNGLQDT